VHLGRTLQPARDGLGIEYYRPSVYVDRAQDRAAQEALDGEGGAVCLVGCAGSGKTRLAWELLRRRPEAVVVLPDAIAPPDNLGDSSDLETREVVLLFENLHMAPETWRPEQWRTRIRRLAGRAAVVVTSRSEEGAWEAVLAEHTGFATAGHVFLSPPNGQSLSRDDAQRLAGLLGLDQEEFERRFDDMTPGSLLIERDQPPPERRADLPKGAEVGIAIAHEARHAVPNNLPLLQSTFVGRRRELEEVARRLREHRLVTLIGEEGRGKTRLAGRTAHNTADAYPAGAWWVDLVAVTDPTFVPHAVGAVLGVGQRASLTREEVIAERLTGGRSLLVLNGYEHVAAGAAALARRLLALAPELTILGTGPAPLGVKSESAYEVPPLPGPVAGTVEEPSAAERLFFDRAADGRVAADDRTDVADLCRELDNNPLAIEIAAARARGAGVARVISDLRERPRGDAIGDAILMTLAALDQAGTTLFNSLAVFSGWWTLDAAVAVVGPDVAADKVPDLLRALVDHALVLIDERDDHGQRFLLLEAVRAHAKAQLEATECADATRERHARHYLELARDAREHLDGTSGGEWLERVLSDRNNLRSALRWSIETPAPAVAFGLGAALWPVWQRKSQFANGRKWLDRLLEIVPEPLGDLALLVAETYNGAGNLAYDACDYDEAQRHHKRCLDIRREVGADELTAGSLNNLGLIARRRGDLDGAEALFGRAVELSRRYEHAQWVAIHLNNLGNCVREAGTDLEAAGMLQQESYALFSRIGSEWGAAMALCDLGWITTDRGDLETARKQLEASLVMRGRLKDEQGQGQSLNGLGRLDRLEEHPAEAEAKHKKALRIFDQLDDRLRMAESYECEGLAQLDQGHRERAAELLENARDIRVEIGAPLAPSARPEIDRAHALVGLAE
jgi:non-specific serine/threonine protein kinase